MWLNKQSILIKVSEEELYFYYTGIDVNKKVKKNPIRKEDHCSFTIKRLTDGRIRWSDFGTKQIGRDVFDLMGLIKGWTFYESLIHINNDFKLGFQYSEKYNIDFQSTEGIFENNQILEKYKEKESILEVVLNKYSNKHIFTKIDIEYWNTGMIQKNNLIQESVFSVATVLLNGNPIWNYHKNNPIYLYLAKEIDCNIEIIKDTLYYKIYRPLNKDKRYKWLNNIKNSSRVIDGFSSIRKDCSYIIITKSRKDMISLKILGYNAINIQSETNGIADDIINYLWKLYKVIYVLFDNDTTGIEYGNKFAEKIDAIPIFYPMELGIKDTWDLNVLTKNKDKSIEIINKLMI